MIRRPPRSTPKPSSAASDVYKRQSLDYPCAIPGLSLDYLWTIPGLSLCYHWVIPVLSLGYPWIILVPSLGYPWTIRGRCLDYPCAVTGPRMRRVPLKSRRCCPGSWIRRYVRVRPLIRPQTLHASRGRSWIRDPGLDPGAVLGSEARHRNQRGLIRWGISRANEDYVNHVAVFMLGSSVV